MVEAAYEIDLALTEKIKPFRDRKEIVKPKMFTRGFSDKKSQRNTSVK